MRVLKLTIAYDGSRFVGWQRQSDGESIQGLLEEALGRLEGAAVTVHGAGRTDAGVHALGQVASVHVSFAHDIATVARALNAQLPGDIRVIDVANAPADFHARFSATSKTYRYRLRTSDVADPFDRAYAWHVGGRLNLDAMRAAAATFVGSHDFAAFRSTGTETCDTTRAIVRSELWLDGPLMTYEIAGTGFLRHMVRAIVGTLVEIGRGWRPAASVSDLLAGGTRAEAGATAPAHGLFLVRVDYDE